MGYEYGQIGDNIRAVTLVAPDRAVKTANSHRG